MGQKVNEKKDEFKINFDENGGGESWEDEIKDPLDDDNQNFLEIEKQLTFKSP